jgi:uncharacterized protein (DUF779 family)
MISGPPREAWREFEIVADVIAGRATRRSSDGAPEMFLASPRRAGGRSPRDER